MGMKVNTYVHHVVNSSIPVLDQLEDTRCLVITVHLEEGVQRLSRDSFEGGSQSFQELFYLIRVDSEFDVYWERWVCGSHFEWTLE